MTHSSIVRQLVWKDVQLHRTQLVFTILCGVAALTLLLWRQEPTTVVCTIICFIALIFASAMLPSASVLNERKRQTLPFLMSLPISAMQYTTAKLIGTVGMFVIPWSAIAVAAIW